MNKLPLILAAALAWLLTGCFTGVESTPRITSRDVRRHHSATVTPEMTYTGAISPEAPGEWTAGKLFYVTDPKIAYILTPYDAAAHIAPGDTLTFAGICPAASMTDVDDSDISFITARGDTVSYRVAAPPAKIAGRAKLEIPFTIELSIVDKASALLDGNRYYITTPLWFNADGDNIAGRQLVEVRVDSVTAANDKYPLAIHFTDTADGTRSLVYMSIGSGARATRNFDTLFSLSDPRRRYKDIAPDVWDCITRCTVKPEMTREECRLALGNPVEIVRAHYLERWNYSDGRYLIFDDGHLTRFRI